MTTYSLMDGAGGRPGNGPAAPTAFAGNFTCGLIFSVTSNGLWLDGYRNWVPPGGDTAAKKFCLWQLANPATNQVLVPNSAVTSGTQTAGAWNFTALPAPLNLSGSVAYVACMGWVSVNGFPDTQNQFGAGNPFPAGIVNGPLQCYSDQGGTNTEPFTTNYNQGLFGTTTADPTVTMPTTGDVHSNFWIDVVVDTVPPAGASYRLWPNQPYPVSFVADTAFNFTLGCEFTLSQACALNRIWYYSQAGVTQLATEAAIYRVSGQSIVPGTDNAAPAWSGAAGAGWVSVSYAGVTLPAGDYKVAVFNGAGVPAVWNATTGPYWTVAPGLGGITNGPVTAPDSAHAAAPGQDTFNQGTPITYPLTVAAPPANYWVDVEVTPLPPGPSALAGAPDWRKASWKRELIWS